jgi:hypothetical protein
MRENEQDKETGGREGNGKSHFIHLQRNDLQTPSYCLNEE